MPYFKMLLLIITGFFLTACSLSKMAEKILPDEVQTQMEEIIDAVIDQDFATVKSYGSDEFKAIENLDETFTEIFEYILTGDASSRKLVNATVNYNRSLGQSGVTHYTGQYEINYIDGSNLYTIILVKRSDDQCCSLQTVNVQQFDSPPGSIMNFTFKNKGLKHYLVLMAAILVPIFIIINLVKCARTKGLERKWLWILFILVGLYGISFNWHTGQMGFSFFSKTETGVHLSIISFQILGVGVGRAGLLAPWLFEIGFPLGALMFWIKSRKQAKVIPVETSELEK